MTGSGPRTRPINRRRALVGIGGAIGAFSAFTVLPPLAHAKTDIRDYRLKAGGPTTVPLVGADGPATDVWAYNGAVPGPIIRARRGERLRIHVENALAQPTTIHLHGIRLPNGMDGVPFLT